MNSKQQAFDDGYDDGYDNVEFQHDYSSNPALQREYQEGYERGRADFYGENDYCAF